MSLKSIRESYSKLLTTFNDAGVKLNESQKNDVDNFVLALESTMSKQRESAIRKTKKAVTAKLEKDFQRIFESVMQKVAENNEYAAKIQKLSTRLDECKKIAGKVDSFLNLYVESVLPKKTIVDYDKMQKYEKIQESLKDLLVANEDAVEAKKAALDESFKSEKSKCETEVAKMQVKLEESMKQNLKLQKKLASLKAVELLESKTKDLPSFEAHAVKKRLAEATANEVEEKFDKTLESVREEAKKVAECSEATLDEEIDKIVENDDEEKKEVSECDIKEADEADVDEAEEDFETTEQVKFNEDGEVELDEDEVIDADLMKEWCNRAIEVK